MTATSEHNGEKIYYNEEAEEWRYVTTNKPIKQGILYRLRERFKKGGKKE